MSEDINYHDLRVEKISEKCIDRLCELVVDIAKPDEVELRDFLLEDAFRNQEEDYISRTYLIFHNPSNALVGYVTLLTDNIHIRNTTIKEKFEKMNIPYDSLPALKIGRMCVTS